MIIQIKWLKGVYQTAYQFNMHDSEWPQSTFPDVLLWCPDNFAALACVLYNVGMTVQPELLMRIIP